MRFIEKGPNIPEALLRDHEDGNLVLFCGAGVSYPAGLPGFKTLVDKIYQICETNRTAYPLENQAYENGQYDTTLELLERRLPEQNENAFQMRKAIRKALRPNLKKPNALETHKAILRLSKNKDNKIRLVTTNFDKLFQKAAQEERIKLPYCKAPLLLLPKKGQWEGITYLHGLLPTPRNDKDLLNLVLTSGDFGRAYLTERWAARFVHELFRQYSICFIGYSINDPILRYMMDAMYADHHKGKRTPKAWAFGSYKSNEYELMETSWRAKGVEPILYEELDSASSSHEHLHATLRRWGESYRDGLRGKLAVITRNAGSRPISNTQPDLATEQMVWALSDETGKPAEKFSQMTGKEIFDNWFNIIKDRFFDVYNNKPLHVSKLCPVQIVNTKPLTGKLPIVHYHLAKWLSSNLDKPLLLDWVAKQGGFLHEELKTMIIQNINNHHTHQKQKFLPKGPSLPNQPTTQAELPIIKKIWKLVLQGMVSNVKITNTAGSPTNDISKPKLDIITKSHIETAISPLVSVYHPYTSLIEIDNDEVKQYANKMMKSTPIHWSVCLPVEITTLQKYNLESLNRSKNQCIILIEMYEHALIRALDLIEYLSDNTDKAKSKLIEFIQFDDLGYKYISEEWTVLLYLIRKSWSACMNFDNTHARHLIERWLSFPYTIFKRLALDAARNKDCIPTSIWASWFADQSKNIMWTPSLQNEVNKIINQRGEELHGQPELWNAIQREIGRFYFSTDTAMEHRGFTKKELAWLNIKEFQSKGLPLSEETLDLLKDINADSTDEFSKLKKRVLSNSYPITFRSILVSKDFLEYRDDVPEGLVPTVEWLSTREQRRKRKPFTNWKEKCQNSLDICMNALSEALTHGNFPEKEWEEFLEVLDHTENSKEYWTPVWKDLGSLEDNNFNSIVNTLSSWTLSISEQEKGDKSFLLNACKIIFRSLTKQSADNIEHRGDNYPEHSINSPAGKLSATLINVYLSMNEHSDDSSRSEVLELLNSVLDQSDGEINITKAIFGLQLTYLYDKNADWTTEKVVSMLDWRIADRASMVWQGFFASNIMHETLVNQKTFKENLLACSVKYQHLGVYKENCCLFMVYIALEKIGGYNKDELMGFFAKLPKEGVEKLIIAIRQALQDAGDRREEHWKNRTKPFWVEYIPKDREKMSDNFVMELAKIIPLTGKEFKSAYEKLNGYLHPIIHIDYITYLLKESGACKHSPTEALSFLNKIFDARAPYLSDDFKECLDEIELSNPKFTENDAFVRLKGEYQRLGTTNF